VTICWFRQLLFILMSDAKLKKFLDRPSKFLPNNQKVILLSDSKGRYLARDVKPRWNIDFNFKSGRRLAEGRCWLQTNIEFLSRRHKVLHLFVWLGTCDLTKKRGLELNLQHSSLEECYKYVTEQVCRFFELVAKYKNIRLVFLEIPPYSMVHWYRTRGLRIDDKLSAAD